MNWKSGASFYYALQLSLFAFITQLVVACGADPVEVPRGANSTVLNNSKPASVQYLCSYSDPEENTSFEFRVAAGSSEATLNYRYSPIAHPGAVEGQVKLRLAAATWSLNVFTGNDSTLSVNLNVPRTPRSGAAYARMSVVVEGKTYEPSQFLECQRSL